MTSNNPMDKEIRVNLSKGWDILNDLITEIVQLKSFAECIRIVLYDFDELRVNGDKNSYDHVNRMLSMLDMNECKIDSLYDTANKAFDTIIYNKG